MTPTPVQPRPAPQRSAIYYGWVLVATLAVAETTSWGVLYYAFTVFLDPMHQDLGWSRAEISGAFSLALLLSGLMAVPLGRWLDRRGPRLLMTAGSCAAVALLLAWSAVHTLAAFYLIWAALGIVMAAVLYEPAFWIVSTWFVRRRGQALTVLTLIAGLASVIYVPLAGWLVAAQGWRHALITLAVLVGIGTIPLHALVLRRRPEDVGLAPDGEPPLAQPDASRPQPPLSIGGVTLGSAMRASSFWLVTCAFFFGTLATGVVFAYFVPYLTDRGYAPGLAATLTGLIGIAALPGRLVLTPLGDHMPRGRLAAAIFLAQAGALLLLLRVPSTVGVVSFVVLFGAGFGAITPARAGIVADYYGPRHFGSINGSVAMASNMARALAPVGGGIVYELSGGYGLLLGGLALLLAVAVIAALFAERAAMRSGLYLVRQ